jgi:hypothetical protein
VRLFGISKRPKRAGICNLFNLCRVPHAIAERVSHCLPYVLYPSWVQKAWFIFVCEFVRYARKIGIGFRTQRACQCRRLRRSLPEASLSPCRESSSGLASTRSPSGFTLIAICSVSSFGFNLGLYLHQHASGEGIYDQHPNAVSQWCA